MISKCTRLKVYLEQPNIPLIINIYISLRFAIILQSRTNEMYEWWNIFIPYISSYFCDNNYGTNCNEGTVVIYPAKHELITSYYFKDGEIVRKSSQPTRGESLHGYIKHDSMASQRTVEQGSNVPRTIE